jgi:translin
MTHPTPAAPDVLRLTAGIREALSARTAARDEAIGRSRELIRHCAECIRAVHRREWDEAAARLRSVDEGAASLKATVSDLPDLYHSGYTQDALKEVVEAHLTYAIIRDEAAPTREMLGVEPATYLLGMGEAATELRRFVLDTMRRETRHSADAERLLAWMDAIYDELVTYDFPDAVTNGLRRQTDVVRGVLERTRGDLTHSLRQQRLQDALAALEERVQRD